MASQLTNIDGVVTVLEDGLANKTVNPVVVTEVFSTLIVRKFSKFALAHSNVIYIRGTDAKVNPKLTLPVVAPPAVRVDKVKGV